MAPNVMAGDYFFAKNVDNQTSPIVRGDIIVFKAEKFHGIAFFKRVIGLSGDEIYYQNGRLYLNGDMLDRVSQGKTDNDFSIYEEHISEDVSYKIIEKSDSSFGDNTQRFVVPENHIFVLGDNRDNSNDSRFPQFGFIPIQEVTGVVSFIYWSSNFSRIGTLTK